MEQNAIEFRVEGNKSAAVAKELAEQLKSLFNVTPQIRETTPQGESAAGQKSGALETIIVLVHVAILTWEAYMKFIRDPAEESRRKLVEHWKELKEWAKKQSLLDASTKVRLLLGEDEYLLDACDPEEVHARTRNAIQKVSVTAQ